MDNSCKHFCLYVHMKHIISIFCFYIVHDSLQEFVGFYSNILLTQVNYYNCVKPYVRTTVTNKGTIKYLLWFRSDNSSICNSISQLEQDLTLSNEEFKKLQSIETVKRVQLQNILDLKTAGINHVNYLKVLNTNVFVFPVHTHSLV